MYNRILVALALTHGHGSAAMKLARRLRAEGGEIVALHVIDAVPGFAKYYLEKNNIGEITKAAEAEIAERIGDEKDAKAVVISGHPGRSITDYAEEIGADCIIVGCHKPGLQDYLLGSTAARIVLHANCSVLVLR